MRQLAIAIKLLIVTGFTVWLTACGGSGGGGDDTIDNTPPPPTPLGSVQNGVFKDSNVSGLEFASGAEMGVTDANGRFTCETGANIVFSLGGVNLGAAECATLIMPPSLVASGAIDATETVNIARFLQMLDVDGDVGNGLPMGGIEISNEVRTLSNSWLDVDFTTLDLTTELASIITDLGSTSTTETLPNATDALQHLEDALACAYGGAFMGRFSGQNSGAMHMVVGAGFFGQFQPRAANWFAWDSKADVLGPTGGGSMVVELNARPTINTDPFAAGPIMSRYVTPDRIQGTWNGGSFDVWRLGGDVGEYRYIGEFTAGVSEGLLAQGAIALQQNGNAISGEAFETTEGIQYQVTGTVSGDSMSLQAVGGGETINAGLTISRMGMEPVSATGGWPGGSINLVACRLN